MAYHKTFSMQKHLGLLASSPVNKKPSPIPKAAVVANVHQRAVATVKGMTVTHTATHTKLTNIRN